MINYFFNIYKGIVSLLQGMFVTFKNLISHAITLQYPRQKQPMTARYRGLVDIHTEKCIICYQCVKICPTGCLAISHIETPEKKRKLKNFKYNMELCCFCGLCDQVCPTSAVYMGKIYEIATYGHENLYINLLDTKKYDEWLHPPVK